MAAGFEFELYENLTGYVKGNDTVGVISNIRPPDASELFSIFPNPSYGALNICFSHPENGIARLLNVSGSEVQAIAFNGASLVMDLGGLPAGVYFIRVETRDAVVTRKVIVARR